MNNKKDSIAKGGGSLVIARVLGMAFSFLLFVFLARHSVIEAGQFRTVMTYMIIAEYLGMLGMHRWLATEMAIEGERQWPAFLAMTQCAILICALMSLVYIGVSYAGIYSPDLSLGILLAAYVTIACGIYDCVQAAYVGLGKSHDMAKLNIIENVVRSLLALLLLKLGYSVIAIIVVYIGSRWLIALLGLYRIKQLFHGVSWFLPKSAIKPMLQEIIQQSPKFIVIIAAFILLRNSAMVILPAVKTEQEVALLGVAYQLFDLILVAPSMLAISANNVFVNKAEKSLAALKRVSSQLISLTSVTMFPLLAIMASLSSYVLKFLYGAKYLEAALSLQWLMLASMLMIIDQVLSQIMLSKRDYRGDMISIAWGGLSAMLLAAMFSYGYGHNGAAFSIFCAITINVLIRMIRLQFIFPWQLLLRIIWRPLLSALVIYLTADVLQTFAINQAIQNSAYLWILWVPLLLLEYIGMLFLLGGINLAKRKRLKQFLFQR